MKKHYHFLVQQAHYLLRLTLIFGACITTLQAQEDFPFDELPLVDGAFNNTVAINTSGGVRPFNNFLLGSNVDFNSGRVIGLLSRADLLRTRDGVLVRNRTGQGFNGLEGQRFIAENDPVVIRFPQGVFMNFYNWERIVDEEGEEIAAADSRNIVDPLVVRGEISHTSPIDVRVGYPSLRGIFDTAEANGKPLDLLTGLNVVGNDADSNLRRWESMINDGFDVRDMELGNEFFFRTQRSGTIDTEAKWRVRARAIVEAIRNRAQTLGRTVRFAIPIAYRPGDPREPQSRRDGDQRFNDLITQDESFFDALVVHRYVRERRTNDVAPEDLNANDFGYLLRASYMMNQSLEYCKGQVSEDKNAIWLTEWGVAGSGVEGVGASFLGTADTYTHFIRNEQTLEIERLNWFSSHGSNAQYTATSENGEIVTRRTGYGDIYTTFRDNLKDATIFNQVDLQSPMLTEAGEPQDVTAINVVTTQREDGTPRLIITNKANRPARVALTIDGNPENVINYNATGFTWTSLSTTTSTPYADQQNDVDAIVVPAYSFVKVDMSFGIGTPILSTESIDGIDNQFNVIIHPNPASSTFNITLNDIREANVVITDMLGKEVFRTRTTTQNLQLQNDGLLKSGIYLVRVTDQGNRSFVSKLVVN